MPDASVNGIRIHYQTDGQGEALLLINGLSAPAVGFLFQVRDLSPHYRVITFDNRGVGETGVAEGQVYPTAQMADDAAGLLRHLGIARAHVLGTSMEGPSPRSWPFAIRRPSGAWFSPARGREQTADSCTRCPRGLLSRGR